MVLKLLIMTVLSVSLLMWHSHCSRCYSKAEMQQLYCSSISSLFKGLACENCCSPTQCSLLRLKTEILNRQRELGFFNTEKRRLLGRPHRSLPVFKSGL